MDDVLLTIKTFWVISDTEPTLTLDTINYGDMQIVLPNGFSFGRCIHDDATIIYPILGAVFFPATTPSYTTFTSGMGIWIGTPRVVGGGADNDKHPHRWKVTSISEVMQ